MKSESMNAKRFIRRWVVIILVLASLACQKSQVKTQLQVGVWAAQNDLWEEAIFHWKKVLEIKPDSAAAHNNLGVAYEKKGLWEEALKEYEQALKLTPKNTYVESNLKKIRKKMKDAAQPESKGKPSEKEKK